jgi:hypothetical protein
VVLGVGAILALAIPDSRSAAGANAELAEQSEVPEPIAV